MQIECGVDTEVGFNPDISPYSHFLRNNQRSVSRVQTRVLETCWIDPPANSPVPYKRNLHFREADFRGPICPSDLSWDDLLLDRPF